MKRAFTIVRVSAEDQLRGYGPDVQWFEDVLPNAPLLGLEATEAFRRVIQEPATSWERSKFESAVREALDFYNQGQVEALLFPRVDRETRFLFGSFPLLAEVVQAGLQVYFAREKFRLDPNDPESIERYLSKATQAQAYVETMRLNTMRGRRRRAIQDHMMPTGRSKWAHDYHCYRKDSHQAPDEQSGRYTVNPERAGCVRKWVDWILVDGLSINKCCQRMLNDSGIKIHRSTMVYVLSDPALIGKFYAYETKVERDVTGRKHKARVNEKDWLLVYEDPGQAILTEVEFYALRARFQHNKENSPRSTKHYYPPLKSLILHSCGRRMVGVYRNGQPWYRCLPCRAWIKAMPLWEQVRDGIKERLLDPGRLVPAIKSQLDSGQNIAYLEEELKSNKQRMETLDEAEQKALRLHLYLSNYPPEKLQAEIRRIKEQRKQLDENRMSLDEQLAELKQAVVDEQGLRRFCEIAARKVETLDDAKWRTILEAMHLQIHLDDNAVTIRVSVPAVDNENSEIVSCTSRWFDRRSTELTSW
ncbi:MAG: recombinase family protein [Chloroflexota bacterium]